ncbi:helix-hairpin-helix domain-containing protein [Sphaerisporangium viridialbum]|uniref:helix-hairpin-helix domain-containing protein n=1 Tax=Sphaerisporangium viridialbum TaxID=46189 RepID=UPI003C78962F
MGRGSGLPNVALVRTADRPPESEIGEFRLRALAPLGQPRAPRPPDHDVHPAETAPANQLRALNQAPADQLRALNQAPDPAAAARTLQPAPDSGSALGVEPALGPGADAAPGTGPALGYEPALGLGGVNGSVTGSAPAGWGRSEPVPFHSLRARLGDVVSRHGPLLDPGRPGLRVLLVLGLLAALVGGVYAWRSRPVAEPLGPPIPQGISPGGSTPQGGPISQGGQVPLGGSPAPYPAAAPSPTAQVIVQVAGKVRKPGVITLPSGSRVADAVNAAGGVRAGATAGGLNLARKLTDGEQIIVGAPSRPGLAPIPPSDPTVGMDVPLDLNAATPAQLETLPGVGEVLATRIVEFRQTHSGFRSIDQLREVTGIGERKFADLRDKVRV